MDSRGFSKLLFPTLGACILAQAIICSFSVIDGTSVTNNSKNYYVQLDNEEQRLVKKLHDADGANFQKLRELGMVYWQNDKIDLAEPYLLEVWKSWNGSDTKTYNPQFVQDGLNIAGLYLDRNTFEFAIPIYQRILEYDSAHLAPNDPRIGRDWNNLGMCFLQKGETLPKMEDRKSWFEQASKEFEKAQKLFALDSVKYEQQMVSSMQNLVVTYSEMGEDDKAFAMSNAVNRHLDAWNKKMNEANAATPNTMTPTAPQKS